MTQQGLNFLERLKKIRLERATQAENEMGNVETSQPTRALTLTPFHGCRLIPQLLIRKAGENNAVRNILLLTTRRRDLVMLLRMRGQALQANSSPGI